MQFQEVKRILKQHQGDLLHLGVRALAVFGSTVSGKNKKGSDVDILVDFDAKKGFFVFLDLKKYLETLLQCNVDLVSKKALHPALKDRILREAKNVF